MPRPGRASTVSSAHSSSTIRPDTHSSSLHHADSASEPQEMGSMYDYLAKVVLLGPSGSGKTCLLHRFVKNEWRVLCSQTIGVEFASRIVKLGPPGGRRTRIKLQLWDTAGTERFRSVSRSYYRGAAGAVLVYDVGDAGGLSGLGDFLGDIRALASPQCTVVLAGNKVDLEEGRSTNYEDEDEGFDTEAGEEEDLLDLSSSHANSLSSQSTLRQARRVGLGAQQRATKSAAGRVISAGTAATWAQRNRIQTSMDVSALSGDGVEEIFHKLAATILTKIELGEIDPSDPMSGIQYGDADYLRFGEDGGSVRSGFTNGGDDAYAGGVPRRRGMKKKGLVLENMFGGGGNRASGSGRARRCC
ncbi:GTP-binding protein ypt4 [Acrodontium crateriforme]|uniref:GTP-binding protein ypt4 n=1 Tax=Acrodontium crateriforme TaxID=150365 RepID=A0AAQ3R9V9_9PEZI|nr:GTP-binding protein ypt4 [Acrodontium crateriforme]